MHVCRRVSTGNEYAVKIIHSRAIKRHPEHELFLRREIRCLRELQHRNIVNLIAAFWEAGSCFIVLDLAREGDLSERIDSCTGVGRDPANSDCAARYVMQQLLAAIGYMHQRRVIHRDLKLENVLISSSVPAPEPLECLLYDVKVTDFGLSTWLDIDNESLTPVGTPHYFAPEVLQNDYDTRIDFFSLGVILYVMLCGNFPFDPNASDPDALVDSYSWECVSPEGKDMSRRLLEKDPNRRLNHAQCLQHAWLQSQNQPVPDISLVLEEADEDAPDAPSCEELLGGAGEAPSAGTLLCVSAWTGWAVDSLRLHWRRGEVHNFGCEGGYLRQTHHAEPYEMIIAVAQETRSAEDRYQYLGNSLVFFTSECNVLAFQGDDAMTRSRFIAPSDSQIVGLQFQGSHLIGVHLQANPEDGAGAVSEIGGRVGSAVDQVFLTLRRGAVRRYGRRGGQQVVPLELQWNERIVIVEQARRDAHLGNSISFYLSSGKLYKLSGLESTRSRRFAAPAGQQICGLDFDGGGLLSRVSTCPRALRRFHSGVPALCRSDRGPASPRSGASLDLCCSQSAAQDEGMP